MDALLQNVKNYPDAHLRERTQRFGVRYSGIGFALKHLGVSHKKTWQHPKANEPAHNILLKTIKMDQANNRSIVYIPVVYIDKNYIDKSGFFQDMHRMLRVGSVV